MAPSTEAGGPAEPPKVEKEELLKVLEGCSAQELQEMGKRLSRSLEHLATYHEELKAEQQGLREDSETTRSTISMLIQEMQKLEIGAINTVEPAIDEGPLNFVGRYWDMIRPRDNAVQVSEHIGELHKPPQATWGESGKPVEVPGPAAVGIENFHSFATAGLESAAKAISDAGAQAQALFQDGEETAGRTEDGTDVANGTESPQGGAFVGRITGAAQAFQSAAGPFWQRVTDVAGSLPEAFRESSPRSRTRMPVGERSAEELPAAPSTVDPELAAAVAAEVEAQLKPVPTEPAPSAVEPDGMAGSAAAAEIAPVAPDVPPEEGEAAKVEEAAEDDQMSVTIMIECQLTIDDGSVQTVQVKATDRCKEVAKRFVQEHSLKEQFEEPLTKYLKKIENDATKFPVRVQADLLEIRQEYGRK